MSARVEIITFGCRLNIVESEAIARRARDAGKSDLVVVNTCAVTAEAQRQARQAIRRLHRERPTADILVTGCAAQIDPASFATIDGVTRVLGNAHKENVASSAPEDGFVFERGATQKAASASDGQTRAFLAVQNGCDHSCTFCVIPLGRGPSRSAAPDDVLAEARRLVTAGKKEIVLTGVDLTSYRAGDWTLGRLAREILREAPALDRLRLSSIDCIEADAELLDCMANEARLAPHLHLSLQSGDDLILKRMKRRHSRQDAIRFCRELRAARPDIVFGADFIAGFPTETEEMFARTLDLVEDCGLTHLHVFPFSPRPGAPAARMPPVDGRVVKERAARLRAAGDAALARHLTAQCGKSLRVLTERGGLARAADFTPLRTPGAAAGALLDVLVTGHDGRALLSGL
ncbi:MAG: tRNA (N(6)-L-threonylcarbamoyladenosine(37)-C(2))-methylthiotransferase MtaB [Methylocystaceae bacterium]|nr:MAG: tRNA (N(6)-L-threonylcarbamoyladenosine(37)-C(2))-methylthiotransferase MtaB [Methylocystaceae bacterium]